MAGGEPGYGLAPREPDRASDGGVVRHGNFQWAAARSRPAWWAAFALLVTVPILVTTGPPASGPAGASGPAQGAAPFTAHGSIGQAYVLGAARGEHLTVLDASGKVVGGGVADRFGSLIVRTLRPGAGYEVRATNGTTAVSTPPFPVLGTNSAKPSSFYSGQHLHVGLNYVTMRDGITLAATVRLPAGKTLADGPFPTVIEDSGYPIAAPGNLVDELLDPSAPGATPTLLPTTATAVGSLIAPLLGFATVSLQMRGTGCSGGAFDLFGLPTTYDGYDAVQIAGSQPWVLHHKVGLVGISFSGISQLFVAGTDPPDLAAIAPMSATNTLFTTGFPGGMFNAGFAGSWLAQRIHDAQPAPTSGQRWAAKEIADGTATCATNQKLRLQTQNLAALLHRGSHRTPGLYAQRSPEGWARHITVPVFQVGALQDEQTGPQWPTMIAAYAHDSHVWVTMLNGTHADSLGPGTITRWLEFLDLYVADKVPAEPGGLFDDAGLLYQLLADAPSGPLPPVRFTTAPSVAAARADFVRTDPRVRVLFDNGGGSAGPGAFQPVWTAGFSAWPPPTAKVTTLALGPGGALASSAQKASSTTSFRPDPSARPKTDMPSACPTGSKSRDNVWNALPCYDWTPVTGSDGVGFVSAVLTHTEVVVGPASLNLEVRSSAADTDLQATVSAVLPTGQEMYVTSGFLRASDRALTAASTTALQPVPTYAAKTARPLAKGRFTLVRIPIDPIAFAFRAGSRVRVTISAPGGDRPAWTFTTYPTQGKVTDTIALGGSAPSTFAFAVAPGVVAPDAPPVCPSLRGQPCRTYTPAGNGG